MKTAPTRRYSLKKHILFIHSMGLKAKGHESSQGFIVLQGSQARVETVPSIRNNTVTLRQTLLKEGILEKKGDRLVLVQDYSFDSPSTAAGVMMGRNANGMIEWKDQAGRTLKEIQAASEKG